MAPGSAVIEGAKATKFQKKLFQREKENVRGQKNPWFGLRAISGGKKGMDKSRKRRRNRKCRRDLKGEKVEEETGGGEEGQGERKRANPPFSSPPSLPPHTQSHMQVRAVERGAEGLLSR